MKRMTDTEIIAGHVYPIPKLELQNPSGFEKIVRRLSDIEDILGDDYDLERLEVMMTQCMSMREEVSERFRITGSIPVDRLRELVEADKAGRCVVIPENYDGAMFRVWKNQILSSEKFAWMMKKLGKSFFLTHKAAEAALAKEADHE